MELWLLILLCMLYLPTILPSLIFILTLVFANTVMIIGAMGAIIVGTLDKIGRWIKRK
jgi:hypothetical protein